MKIQKILIHARFLMYLSLGYIGSFASFPPFTILCYHSLSNDDWRFSINPSDFKKQLGYLSTKFYFASMHDVYNHLKKRKKVTKPSVVITFDDGYEDLINIRGFLKKLNIRPTLFVLSNPQKRNLGELDTTRRVLSDKQIKQLHKYGWIIGCHSATHPDFNNMSKAEIYREVVASKKALEKRLGFKIHYFAYPKGNYSTEIVAAVKKAGYRLAVSMDDGVINFKTNPFTLPRVGLDRSHTFIEFKSTFIPLAINTRQLLSKTPLAKMII